MNDKTIMILASSIVLIIILPSIALYFLDDTQTRSLPNMNVMGKIENMTDKELLQYAHTSFDKEKMMFRDIVIGYHNKITVRVSFPCSDVCPEYTKRIIRYDVNLDQCENAGGIKRAIIVPKGIGAMAEDFCFPKIIIENNIYEFAEDPVSEEENDADAIYCNETKDLEKCNYGKVKLSGKFNDNVMQHPIIARPGQFQNYINTVNGQFIVISQEDINCNSGSEIEITGTLNPVDFPCPTKDAGKCGYQGYYIETDAYQCL